MNRQTLNYGYGPSLSPNNIQRSHQTDHNKSIKRQQRTDIGTEKHLYEAQHVVKQQFSDTRGKTQINYQRQEAKYYPIVGNDEQISYQRNNSSKLINSSSSQSQNQSTTSFYLNKQARTTKTTDFPIIKKNSPDLITEILTTSPKSISNNHFYQKQKVDHQIIQQIDKNMIDVDQHVWNYLNWMQEAFGQFERTGNGKILREINQKNSTQTVRLFNQLYSQRKQVITTTMTTTNIIQSPTKSIAKSQKQISIIHQRQQKPQQQHLKISSTSTSTILSRLRQQINLLQQQSLNIISQLYEQKKQDKQLQQQLIQEIQIKSGHNLDQSRIRQQNHLKQMQQSVTELEHQIKTLQTKNLQIAKHITNVPFLKQWNLMFEQAKGATKLAIKLRHQIQKKQELIREFTNQDPSNNSDVRSVRRMSENGDRPTSKFTKKENRILNTDLAAIPKPMTPSRPASQLLYRPNQKPDSGRTSTNDVIIRQTAHSNRFSESKKPAVNSVEKGKQRKQSYDQKQHNYSETTEWKGLPFPANLKNIGVGFIGKDVYK